MITSLAQAADCMHATLVGDDLPFQGISTDTRTLSNGELYFALQGPNFDGNNFVEQARAAGAAGSVVNTSLPHAGPQITVDDTRLALGRFAAAWRNAQRAQVVGITGSNGKTTLKELVFACLQSQAPTLATAGNLNNEIGVPLMLARIQNEHTFAVIEMGANHAGEIAYLAGLASPDVVVITNAGEAHLEGFGSVEGVARAKGEIFQTERRPKCAILNADDDYFGYWQSLVADIDSISFGFAASADVRAENIIARNDGSSFRLIIGDAMADIELPLPGIHNVRNACAAAAVATALDISIQSIAGALQNVVPVAGRLQPLPGIHGSTLFDDSYNANPQSVKSAAEFIAGLKGTSWLVLGDMKELGDDAEDLHREVGASARTSGVDRLFALGDLARHSADAFGDGGEWFAGIDAMLDALQSVGADTNVLVKGSRSMRMERAVAALKADEPMRREA